MKDIKIHEEKTIEISNLKPHPQNPKKHTKDQIKSLVENLKEFGQIDPIVVNGNNTILCGHGRVEAFRLMEIEKCRALVIEDLTSAQEMALMIAHNAVTLATGFDGKILKSVVLQIMDLGYDLPRLELNIKPLRDILLSKDDEFVPPQIDEVSTQIKAGDIIELGRHRLVCGNPESPEDFKKLFHKNETIDLIVTDPPYGVSYDPTWRKDLGLNKNKLKMGAVQNDNIADWGAVFEMWKANVAYVWHAGIYAGVVQSFLERVGYSIISQIIWNKDRFALSRGDYHWQHEPCWYAVRKGENHNWQGSRDQSTVWNIKSREGKGLGHGTQKPLECMSRPIQNNSAVDQIISDPFLGSGTTLIACEQLNRICYGMELEPRYCQIIVDRLLWCEREKKEAVIKINGKDF